MEAVLTQSPKLRKTPLYDLHTENGGSMTPWLGQAVASHYRSILDEHRCAIDALALFDLGWRPFFQLEGPSSAEILNQFATLDLRSMPIGALWEVPLVNEAGGLMDLPKVVRQEEQSWFLIFANSHPSRIMEALAIAAAQNECAFEDLSRQYAWVGVSGVRAQSFLADGAASLAALKPHQSAEVLLSGVAAQVMLSHENFFEIACQPELLGKMIRAWWSHDDHPQLCGWASYENWQLENGILRYGRELREGVSPFEIGLDKKINLAGGHDFLGRKSLQQAQQASTLQGLLIHFYMEALRLPRAQMPIYCNEQRVGGVCAGGYGVRLNRPIGSAWVKTDEVDFDSLHVEIRRQRYPLTIKTPPLA